MNQAHMLAVAQAPATTNQALQPAPLSTQLSAVALTQAYQLDIELRQTLAAERRRVDAWLRAERGQRAVRI